MSWALRKLAAIDDFGLDGGRNCTRAASSLLDGHDGLHGLLICDLAEDNMLAVKPRGLFGRNEELGSITIENKTDQPT